MDFLLIFIQLFFASVTAESLRAIIDRKSAISLQRGYFDPQFQVQGVAVVKLGENQHSPLSLDNSKLADSSTAFSLANSN